MEYVKKCPVGVLAFTLEELRRENPDYEFTIEHEPYEDVKIYKKKKCLDI